MKSKTNLRVLSVLRLYVNAASIISSGIGLAALIGWFFGIPALKSFLPGVPAMRFNTALSLLLVGPSLWLLQSEDVSPVRKYVGQAIAALALLISLLTLSEYLFGWNLNIDELFIRDLDSPPNLFPGRMAPIAVLCAGFSSVGLLMLGSRISQYFSLTVMVLSLLAIMNYLFDFQTLYRHPEYFYIGAHTSVTFLILSFAIMAARPTRGIMRMFSLDLPGSKGVRLLLPGIIMLTILMGWLVERGERLGLLDASRESIFLVILLIFVYSPLIYFSAKKVNQADEALRESEDRFSKAFHANTAALALLREDTGLIIDVNDSFCDLTGFTFEEVVEHTSPELNFITPEEHKRLTEESLRQGGAIRNFELTVHRSDGSVRYALYSSERINLEEGSSILAILYDITERKQAEEQLRYQANLLANINDAVVASDENYILKAWNLAAEKIYGWKAEEVLGKNGVDIFQTKFIEADPDEMRQQIVESGDYIGEATQLRKDGTRIPIEVASMVLRDERGKITGYVSINRDVTERKQAEEQIQRQLKHLSGLHMIDIAISSSFDLSIILDVVLQQVHSQLGVDAAALLLFDAQLQTIEYAASRGFRSDALHHTKLKLGEGFAGRAMLERKIIHISDLMETGGKLARALHLEHESFIDYYGIPLIAKGEVKGVLEIYHRSHLKAESEWLEFLETLTGQVAIAIDNAQLFENLQRSNATLERRVAERTAELNHTNAELEHANRTKDEFLANMSHELRTPLASILGLSESLLEQRRGSLNEHQQKSLEVIESSGRHLLELINDILDLSKIEAGKFDFYPQPISVDETCRSSLAFIKAQAAKKSITVTYINETSVSKIYADPRRLKQILVNLLTNAVKFTLENGEVILQVNAIPEQDLIQFFIIDNGIGIAAEDLRRLFQPFVQVDSSLNRQHEGTGLGLAMVQRLTDLHGGSVHVESEVGKGSRFTVSLAIKQDEIAKLENPESHHMPPFSEQTEKPDMPSETPKHLGLILLADDNMANILTMGEYLENHGYEVVVAHDGVEAIEKAETNNPDIILMDIQMPVMNGLEALARLRVNPHFADTPIIALTALAMPDDRERCLQAGASEYMSKPVSLKALKQTIENFLQS